MVIASSTCLASLLIFAVPSEIDEMEKSLAVFGLKAQRDVDEKLAVMLDGLVMSSLKESKRFASLLSSSDIQQLMSLERMRLAVDCDAASCIAEIGGALGVPLLLTGNIGKVGPYFIVNLRLLSVDEAKALVVKSGRFRSEGDLADGIGPLVRETLRELHPEQSRLPAVSGMVAGFAGLATIVFARLRFDASQASYAADQSPANWQALQEETGRANLMLGVGALMTVAGTALWWTSR